MTDTTNHAAQQAKAQIESIQDMLRRYGEDPDNVEMEINNDPLEVSVRSSWTMPGQPLLAEEFRIILCTGGPAVQIIGDLDENGSVLPDYVYIQYQDWGTPWTNYPVGYEERQALADYASFFFPR